jgi:hypothetical protein
MDLNEYVVEVRTAPKGLRVVSCGGQPLQSVQFILVFLRIGVFHLSGGDKYVRFICGPSSWAATSYNKRNNVRIMLKLS